MMLRIFIVSTQTQGHQLIRLCRISDSQFTDRRLVFRIIALIYFLTDRLRVRKEVLVLDGGRLAVQTTRCPARGVRSNDNAK